MMRFTRVDLPTLGRPTTARTGVGPRGVSPSASYGPSNVSLMMLLGGDVTVTGCAAAAAVCSAAAAAVFMHRVAVKADPGQVNGACLLGAHVLVQQQRMVLHLFPSAGPGVGLDLPGLAQDHLDLAPPRRNRGRTALG